jgi:hypothetical protein
MKRWSLAAGAAFVLALASATPARAQLSVGVSTGPTYSSLGGGLITSTESDWGALLGGYGQYGFLSNLTLQLEVNWTQKGGRGSVQEGGVDSDLDFDLDYLEIPFTAQFGTALGERWKWNLYGGISVGFQTTCDVRLDDGDSETCEDGFPTWDFAATEWSVPFGTSFTYRLTRSALTADFRYSYGLSAAIENLDLKNRSWQFILRWGFEV